MIKNSYLNTTRFRLHISNIIFFMLNAFHIIVASTSKIELKADGILRFQINFFTQFNLTTIIIAIVVVSVEILLSYLILIKRFRSSDLSRITDLGLIGENDDKISKNLRVDPKLIFKWVRELAAEQKINSIKRIYLTDTNIPNALTLDVIPLPFVRCTWIVLDANVLEILDEREIKAVISHELGHVKRLNGIVNLFRLSIYYFVFVAYSFLILQMIYHIIADKPIVPITIALRIAYLIVILLVIWIFTLINLILMNFSRRQSELMADYYAAKKTGRNDIINALVLLGQRLDVIAAFGTEFRWLGSLEGKDNLTREFVQGLKALPPEELSKDISREKAVSIYVNQRLKNLKEDLYIPLLDDQIEELTNQASKKLLEIREKSLEDGLVIDREIRSELYKLTIDWFLVDKDKDQYLKDEEIINLVKTIQSNPGKELFEQDIHNKRSLFGFDHPSMRERILFLYYSTFKIPSE